jgi:uncharacterized membrane protein
LDQEPTSNTSLGGENSSTAIGGEAASQQHAEDPRNTVTEREPAEILNVDPGTPERTPLLAAGEGEAEARPRAEAARADLEVEEDEEEEEDEEDRTGVGPNWMLAFVCAWAGGTALFEAPAALKATDPMSSSLERLLPWTDRLFGCAGLSLLGIGLLLFAGEALLWGKRRQGIGPVLAVVFPALLTLAGIIFLFLSHYSGHRI